MTPAPTSTRAAAGSGRPAAATGASQRRRAVSTNPRAFRRVSGPAAPRHRDAATPERVGLRPLPVLGTIGSHALRAGKTLNGLNILDRLLRGRGWIALLGVLLIGLVALNVGLLRLNAQAGRNAAAARELRIKNAELGGKVARLSSAERLLRAGEKLGLVLASPGSIHYLKSRGAADGKRAASRIDAGVAAPQATEPAAEPAPTATDPTVVADHVEPAATDVEPAATDVAPAEPHADGGGVPPVAAEPVPGTG